MLRRLALTLFVASFGTYCFAADDKSKPDANGFISLFDGKTLDGWEGLPGLWSVKDGVIDGSEKKETSKQTDLILSDSKDHPEKYTNFELHLSYRLLTPDGNSGIQFRSKIDKPEMLHVGGYQADIDNRWNLHRLHLR